MQEDNFEEEEIEEGIDQDNSDDDNFLTRENFINVLESASESDEE